MAGIPKACHAGPYAPGKGGPDPDDQSGDDCQRGERRLGQCDQGDQCVDRSGGHPEHLPREQVTQHDAHDRPEQAEDHPLQQEQRQDLAPRAEPDYSDVLHTLDDRDLNRVVDDEQTDEQGDHTDNHQRLDPGEGVLHHRERATIDSTSNPGHASSNWARKTPATSMRSTKPGRRKSRWAVCSSMTPKRPERVRTGPASSSRPVTRRVCVPRLVSTVIGEPTSSRSAGEAICDQDAVGHERHGEDRLGVEPALELVKPQE